MGGLQIHQNSVPIIIWQYSLMKIEWLFSYSRWHLTKTVDWNSFIEYSAKLIARLVTRSSVELWQASHDWTLLSVTLSEMYSEQALYELTSPTFESLPCRVKSEAFYQDCCVTQLTNKFFSENIRINDKTWMKYVLDNVWTSMRFVYMTAAAVLREAGERPL